MILLSGSYLWFVVSGDPKLWTIRCLGRSSSNGWWSNWPIFEKFVDGEKLWSRIFIWSIYWQDALPMQWTSPIWQNKLILIDSYCLHSTAYCVWYSFYSTIEHNFNNLTKHNRNCREIGYCFKYLLNKYRYWFQPPAQIIR